MEQERNTEVSLKPVRLSILLTVMFSLLGYFVYGSINGALAILLLDLVCDLTVLVSVIPFVGCLIQAFLMKMIIPKIAAITGIHLTWLTTAIFWTNLLFGVVVTAIVSIMVLKEILSD